MLTIYTLEEIKELRNISKEMREELLTYFEEIAKGIVENKCMASLQP